MLCKTPGPSALEETMNNNARQRIPRGQRHLPPRPPSSHPPFWGNNAALERVNARIMTDIPRWRSLRFMRAGNARSCPKCEAAAEINEMIAISFAFSPSSLIPPPSPRHPRSRVPENLSAPRNSLAGISSGSRNRLHREHAPQTRGAGYYAPDINEHVTSTVPGGEGAGKDARVSFISRDRRRIPSPRRAGEDRAARAHGLADAFAMSLRGQGVRVEGGRVESKYHVTLDHGGPRRHIKRRAPPRCIFFLLCTPSTLLSLLLFRNAEYPPLELDTSH